MDITQSNIVGLLTGFKTTFNKGFKNAETYWQDIAMKVPSATESETYAWLGDMPGIRKWLGDRVVHALTGSRYRIVNELFEETIAVPRTKIEDDQYGIYGPMVEKLGHDTAHHPDTLIFDLLPRGFLTPCYDGQYFFDTDHPVGAHGATRSVSNMQPGDGTPWYLIDASQPIRPLIYQERLPFNFTALNNDNDDLVFMKDVYVYGVRGRSNAGFGLWQMAFASRAALNAQSYDDARTAMRNFTNDAGRPLGIRPTHLIVPPSMEGAARRLLEAELINAGDSNVWRGSAKLIVNPYLDLYQPA